MTTDAPRTPVDLAAPGRLARGADDAAAARRAVVLGLVNVLAASLAAAGQWASWRTENELGLDLVGGTDWWRVAAVFAANLVPSSLAVVTCLTWAAVWRAGTRRRVLVVGAAALASAVLRLGLLATLRYSPGDVWFVVVELLFGVLAVVVAVALALYDHDVGVRLRAAELRRRAEEVRAQEAARRAEEADLEVRRDVSRRLHGSLQQRLVLLTRRLEELSSARDAPEGTAAELRAVAREIDEVREHDVRELSHALLPLGVDIGLREALFLALGRLPSTVSTTVTLDDALRAHVDVPGRPRMPVRDRLLVLDVVQEGVTNAVRHGGARSIVVRLGVELTKGVVVVVSVEDDGVGLAGPPPRESGLAVLRERVTERGGSLEVGGTDAGASLVVRLPMQVPVPPPGSEEPGLPGAP